MKITVVVVGKLVCTAKHGYYTVVAVDLVYWHYKYFVTTAVNNYEALSKLEDM